MSTIYISEVLFASIKKDHKTMVKIQRVYEMSRLPIYPIKLSGVTELWSNGDEH